MYVGLQNDVSICTVVGQTMFDILFSQQYLSLILVVVVVVVIGCVCVCTCFRFLFFLLLMGGLWSFFPLRC